MLLKKLYEQGISGHLWTVIQSMYNGLTARVKWEGDISSSFRICQGVRQGRILSTHFYKTYINNLLVELEEQSLGINIGDTYVGCPTCADDALLLSTDSGELQTMLSLAYTYSQEHRYHIHPKKTTILRKNANKSKLERELISTWNIGPTVIKSSDQHYTSGAHKIIIWRKTT